MSNPNSGLAQTPAYPARQRILDAAATLIHANGYRATGVSQIIGLADVAKATFYAHFQSKEELCLEYLQQAHADEMAELRAGIESEADPLARFLNPARSSQLMAAAGDFRGCRFLNISTEMREAPAFTAITTQHYKELRQLLLELTAELIESDPATYSHLDARQIADAYLVLIGGGLSIGQAISEAWPTRAIELNLISMLTGPSS